MHYQVHVGKWASIFVVPIVDKTGVVTCVSGCVTDITDQKRRQQDAINRAETLEKLRASEKRFHKFAQHALCPIYIYDTNRQVSRNSQRIFHETMFLTGYSYNSATMHTAK